MSLSSHFSPHRLARLRQVCVWLVLCAMFATGCSSLNADTTPGVAGSPTSTQTPAREVIVIDGEPVRQVFIPDRGRDPLYALTATALYRRQSGRWEKTRTLYDGRTILVDPVNPDRLFRGNHAGCSLTSTTTEIPFEVSHDGGMSWRVQPQGHDIQPLAIDPSIPNIIYGSSCHLAISTTSGNTWQRLALMEDYPLTGIAFAGERLLVLGTSLDGVTRLRAVDVTDPAKPLAGDVLLEIPGRATLDARGDRIVVGGVQSVYVSDDGGTTWSTSRFGLESVTANTVPSSGRPSDSDGDQVGVHIVRLGTTDKQRIYAGTSHGLYISQDGAATWVRYDEIVPSTVVIDIQFALNGADLFVTTDKGVVSVPNP